MADNSAQNGTDTIRDKDRAGVKTQIVGLDLGVGGSESLMNGTTTPLPIGHGITGIADGVKTVTTAGTRVTLAASTAARWVTITAFEGNTGCIVVGGTTVVATAGTSRRGTPLWARDSITLAIDDLNDVNLDATVSGEGVSYSYLT